MDVLTTWLCIFLVVSRTSAVAIGIKDLFCVVPSKAIPSVPMRRPRWKRALEDVVAGGRVCARLRYDVMVEMLDV